MQHILSFCRLCAPYSVEQCMDRSPAGSNWVCTRPVNHKGDHVACAPPTHKLAIWENEANSCDKVSLWSKLSNWLNGHPCTFFWFLAACLYGLARLIGLILV